MLCRTAHQAQAHLNYRGHFQAICMPGKQADKNAGSSCQTDVATATGMVLGLA
jgi:hypothetical protein